jgi:predicted transcriptional regulator
MSKSKNSNKRNAKYYKAHKSQYKRYRAPKVLFPMIQQEMDTKQRIWFLIKTKKATSLTLISKILGKTKSTISQHLKELSKSGKIRSTRNGKQRIYTTGRKFY